MNRFLMLPIIALGSLPLSGCLTTDALIKSMESSARASETCQALPTSDSQIRRLDQNTLHELLRNALDLDRDYWPKGISTPANIRRDLAPLWFGARAEHALALEQIVRHLDAIDETQKNIRKKLQDLVDDQRAIYQKGFKFPFRNIGNIADKNAIDYEAFTLLPIVFNDEYNNIGKLSGPILNGWKDALFKEEEGPKRAAILNGKDPKDANEAEKKRLKELSEIAKNRSEARTNQALYRSIYLVLTGVAEIEQDVVALTLEVEALVDALNALSTSQIGTIKTAAEKIRDKLAPEMEKFKDYIRDQLWALGGNEIDPSRIIELAMKQDEFFEAIVRRETGRLAVRLLHRSVRSIEERLDTLSSDQWLLLSVAKIAVSAAVSEGIAFAIEDMAAAATTVDKSNILGPSIVYGLAVGACSRLLQETNDLSAQTFRADETLRPVYEGMVRAHTCFSARNRDQCLKGAAPNYTNKVPLSETSQQAANALEPTVQNASSIRQLNAINSRIRADISTITTLLQPQIRQMAPAAGPSQIQRRPPDVGSRQPEPQRENLRVQQLQEQLDTNRQQLAAIPAPTSFRNMFSSPRAAAPPVPPVPPIPPVPPAPNQNGAVR
jgi:hypothetical protein